MTHTLDADDGAQDALAPSAQGTVSGSDVTPPVTGLDAVDRVVAREPGISHLPVTERAAAHQELHRELEAILTQGPGHPSELTGP